MHMRMTCPRNQSRIFFFACLLLFSCDIFAQAENEIQVYASPTVQPNLSLFELHSNYTFEGSKDLPDPKSAQYLNLSLEFTHGITPNFELGFYIFTTLKPDGQYEY